MARDICILMKRPKLRQQWINIIAQYIRENYGNPLQLDAIVGPDTKGFVFALAMAMKLKLPYISAHELGDFPAESDDDVLRAAYTNARNTVNILLEIYCSVVVLTCSKVVILLNYYLSYCCYTRAEFRQWDRYPRRISCFPNAV